MDEIVDRIKLLPEEQVSAWREAHGTGSDEPLSLRWETSHMWTPEHRDAVATALSDWALEQSDAREALRTIARADRRVGVWLACACARTALRYVPADDESPRLAIETAERWVRGLATQDECKRAADAADAAEAAAEAAADAAAEPPPLPPVLPATAPHTPPPPTSPPPTPTPTLGLWRDTAPCAASGRRSLSRRETQ